MHAVDPIFEQEHEEKRKKLEEEELERERKQRQRKMLLYKDSQLQTIESVKLYSNKRKREH
jgi:predicted Zn-dependent peptidase